MLSERAKRLEKFDDKPEEELPAHQPEMRQSKSRPGSQPQQSPRAPARDETKQE